jgi:uncharacterized membrane protein (DUF4010 family)
MDELEIFQRLGLALAIGLLVGVERGWESGDTSGIRVAGVRTFALIGLYGGIAGWLSTVLGAATLGLLSLGFAALVAVGYWLAVRDDGDHGLTTEIAALLVFALGAAAVLGQPAPAAAVGVVATALLAVKSRLHGWIARIRRLELTAAIELAIISVVVLPILPDRGYGPGGVLNPYALWWAVVLVAALSFAGYVAIRVAGARLGTMIAGLMGGLASSTATTWAFARMARDAGDLARLLAVGAVLAGSVTFLRILAVAAVFNGPLAAALAPPLLAMAATGFAGALVLRLGARSDAEAPPALQGMTNPLDVGTALKFAAFLALVLVATELSRGWFGTAGVYAVAALSGLTDVDAVTISMATSAELSPTTAAGAVVTAASVNTAVKGGIAVALGGWRFGLRVIAVYLPVLAAGALALVLTLS